MDYIIKSTEVKTSEISQFGAKASGLAWLEMQNLKVPDYYLISFSLLLSLESKESSCYNLVNDWITRYYISRDSLWAVRSSTSIEDGSILSFAGLFNTEINVKVDNLPQAIASVLNSYKKKIKKKYGNIDSNFMYGIIIQEMVNPIFSGVIFSKNPNNIYTNEMLINIIPGLGENLVSGKFEALNLKVINQKIIYLSEKDVFYGEVFDGEYNKQISVNLSEIKNQINKISSQLIKTIKKLEELKKAPIDVEFAIFENKIFWLQIRPITVLKNEKSIIWDNSNIGENYPDITLPLSASFVKYTYYVAYNEMIKGLKVEKKYVDLLLPYLKNMADSIYGRLYYNVTSWQNLLLFLPFGDKISKKYIEMLNMEEYDIKDIRIKMDFLSSLKLTFNLLKAFLIFPIHKKKFEQTTFGIFKKYKTVNYIKKSYLNLVDEYFFLEKKMLKEWFTPMLNGLYLLIISYILKKLVRFSRFSEKYPNFTNDILHSHEEVVSVKIVNEFKKLLIEIQQNNQLYNIFLTNEPTIVQVKLENFYPEFNQKILNYIEDFGERSETGELKMEIENYKENPLLFYETLKKNSRYRFEIKKEVLKFDYKTILKNEYKYNFITYFVFIIIINWNINLVKNRENFRFYRTKTFAIARQIFRAIDKDLLSQRWIENSGDSLYLTFNELMEIKDYQGFKSIIKKRKIEYEHYKEIKTVGRYLQQESSLIPIEMEKLKTGNKIIAIGCSSGFLIKKVVIIDEQSLENLEISDAILVANYFEPGWINLFSKAAGIISEKGNILSHTAILCREMGIPSIVGAKGILNRVKNGDLIQMNGTTGEIILL